MLKNLLILGMAAFIYFTYSGTSTDVAPQHINVHNNSPEYKFNAKNFTRDELVIKIKKVSSYEEIQRLAAPYFQDSSDLAAFTLTSENPDENYCEVYIVDPEIRKDEDTLGHEIMHCMYGGWHKD